ncbi:MAG TPA: LemA family protein, partial [Acidobacteriota bacterium]|nr:LemA family protein [Acidobacteriota bacterium]
FPGATASQIENGLVEALRGLLALAEAYPEIRASERYGTLQRQLSEIEDDLQSARRYYNAVVRDHNTAIASFPAVLVAAPLGFAVRQFFEIENPLERHAVRVDLDA